MIHGGLGPVRCCGARVANPTNAEPYLQPGQRARITAGAFSQVEAIFVAHDGNKRVVLLLNIMQKNQELSFPLEIVGKLG